MRTAEITTSRWKGFFYLAGSLAFVAASWATHVMLGVAFFGLGAIVFAWLLMRPRRLVLDDEGFTLTGGLVWSPQKLCWRDIDHFFVYRLAKGGKLIGFNFKPGLRGAGPGFRLNRVFGADGALPRGWTRSPERMVDELNAWRMQAMNETDTTA